MQKPIGTNVFFTFFDKGYLSRGLAMIESVRTHGNQDLIVILALDHETHNFFSQEKQEGIEVISISQIESFEPRLIAAKATRSTMEYYFTCTPHIFRYLFSTKSMAAEDTISYLDADLYFFDDPTKIREALGSYSVGITEHRFSDDLRTRLIKYGKFNAGFLTFKNDEYGNLVLEWWGNQTLDWCSDVPEEGKYANQGYLNSFENFHNVLSYPSTGFNLAPWNTKSSRIRNDDYGNVIVDDSRLLFFHFHGVRRVRNWFVTAQLIYKSQMTEVLAKDIYQPYISVLKNYDSYVESKIPTSPKTSKRGNGLHGFIGRLRKSVIDQMSIVTGNAFKA